MLSRFRRASVSLAAVRLNSSLKKFFYHGVIKHSPNVLTKLNIVRIEGRLVRIRFNHGDGFNLGD